ncbi:MAG: PDZ domain-containing protein [Bacteroidia bacterium]|nr:PDZ domain-containing protein [Bacteroidia bacterium]
MSGLTIKAKGTNLNYFEITAVRGKSASDRAGLNNGDQIVSVNGLPSIALDLNIVNALLNTKPGKKVILEILRNGVRLKKQIVLEDQI